MSERKRKPPWRRKPCPEAHTTGFHQFVTVKETQLYRTDKCRLCGIVRKTPQDQIGR